jgi:hypothetical protein
MLSLDVEELHLYKEVQYLTTCDPLPLQSVLSNEIANGDLNAFRHGNTRVLWLSVSSIH